MPIKQPPETEVLGEEGPLTAHGVKREEGPQSPKSSKPDPAGGPVASRGRSGPAAGEKDAGKENLEGAAALAAEAQPTGTTFETTIVHTKAGLPFPHRALNGLTGTCHLGLLVWVMEDLTLSPLGV